MNRLKKYFIKNPAYKKFVFVFSILFYSSCLLAQKTASLEQFLKTQTKQELQNQLANEDSEEANLMVIQDFKISSDHVLSFQTKKIVDTNTFVIEKQEVLLSDIIAVAKDVQIVFKAKPNTVTTTHTHSQTGNIDLVKQNWFYTYLENEKDNEAVGKKIVTLFQKAGYKITMSDWYD